MPPDRFLGAVFRRLARDSMGPAPKAGETECSGARRDGVDLSSGNRDGPSSERSREMAVELYPVIGRDRDLAAGWKSCPRSVTRRIVRSRSLSPPDPYRTRAERDSSPRAMREEGAAVLLEESDNRHFLPVPFLPRPRATVPVVHAGGSLTRTSWRRCHESPWRWGILLGAVSEERIPTWARPPCSCRGSPKIGGESVCQGSRNEEMERCGRLIRWDPRRSARSRSSPLRGGPPSAKGIVSVAHRRVSGTEATGVSEWGADGRRQRLLGRCSSGWPRRDGRGERARPVGRMRLAQSPI